MLQSSGYFSNISCPYFASGFCERPHCHFKHVRKDSSSTVRHEVPATIDSKADLLKIYSETLRKIQEAEKELLASSTTQVEVPPAVMYIPTPKNVIPRRSSQESHIPAMCMPEYKPTPISQLRRMHKDSPFGDTADYTAAVSSYKRKISEIYSGYSSTQPGKVSKRVEEYDPTKVPHTANCKYSAKLSSSSGSGDDDQDSRNVEQFSDSGDECSSKTDVLLRTGKRTDEESRKKITNSSEAQCDSKFDIVTQILQESKSSDNFIKTWTNRDETNTTQVKSDENPSLTAKTNVKKVVDQGTSENNKNTDKKHKLVTTVDDTTNVKDEGDTERSNKRLKTSSNVEDVKKTTVNEKAELGSKADKDTGKLKSHPVTTNEERLQNQKQHDTKVEVVDKPEKTVKDKVVKQIASSTSKIDICHSNKNGDLNKDFNKRIDENGDVSDDLKTHKERKRKLDKQEDEDSSASNETVKLEKTSDVDRALKSPSKKSSSSSSSTSLKSSSSSSHSSSKKSSHKSSSKKSHKSSSGKPSSSSKTSSSSKSRSENSSSKSSHKPSSGHSTKKTSSKTSSNKSSSEKSSNHSENVSSSSHKSSSSKSSSKSLNKTSSSKSPSKTSSSKTSSDKSSSSKKSSKSTSSSKHSTSSSKRSSDKLKSSGKSSNKSKSHKSSKDDKHSSTKSSNKSKEKADKKSSPSNGNHSKEKIDQKNIVAALSSEDSKWLEYLEAELDNHDELEECWKIFNEESPVVNSQINLIGQKPKSARTQEEQSASTTVQDQMGVRKRVAHNPSMIALTEQSFHKPPPMRKSFTSAAQAMANRFLKLNEAYLKYNEQSTKPSQSPFAGLVPKQRENRVAHVPNAARLAAMSPPRRNSLTQQTSSATQYSTAGSNVTVPSTVCKGERRIAHTPIVAQSKRPIIPASYGNKVPLNIRQRYLNFFIDECLKFATSEEGAYAKGLEEEAAAYERSSNKTVYLNVAVNVLKRLRTEAEAGPPSPPPSPPSIVVPDSPPHQTQPKQTQLQLAQRRPTSHQAMLGGAKAAKTSFSIQRNKPKLQPEELLKGALLYKLLCKYILTQEQLVENGYPQPNPTFPGRAIIKGLDVKKTYSSSSLHRQCSRCQSFYAVDENGIYVRQEECVYHWGNIWRKRIAGSLESRYSCCEGDAESEGCTVGEGHIMETVDLEKVTGFVQTLEKPCFDGDFGVYALDCEMCYTTQGMELTRITVIGDKLKPIYETMVKPENPVLDHNTRFSGITKEDLEDVHTTLRDVQAVLLSLFNQKTILIGHSLESDFKALRLIHNTVVDTTMVFPHRRGPPFKRALRTLMAEHLNKIIQNNDGGHDSQEDAVACLELMLWKIKEDLKCSR